MTLHKGTELETTISSGAAVQAAILIGDGSSQVQNLLFLDVTPLSMDLETVGDAMTKLIERNSTFPRRRDRRS